MHILQVPHCRWDFKSKKQCTLAADDAAGCAGCGRMCRMSQVRLPSVLFSDFLSHPDGFLPSTSNVKNLRGRNLAEPGGVGGFLARCGGAYLDVERNEMGCGP